MNVYHDACHTYEVGHSIECINIKVHLTEIIGRNCIGYNSDKKILL